MPQMKHLLLYISLYRDFPFPVLYLVSKLLCMTHFHKESYISDFLHKKTAISENMGSSIKMTQGIDMSYNI